MAKFPASVPQRVHVAEAVGHCFVLYPTSCLCHVLAIHEMDKTERTRGDLFNLLTCGGLALSNGLESLEPLNPHGPTQGSGDKDSDVDYDLNNEKLDDVNRF